MVSFEEDAVYRRGNLSFFENKTISFLIEVSSPNLHSQKEITFSLPFKLNWISFWNKIISSFPKYSRNKSTSPDLEVYVKAKIGNTKKRFDLQDDFKWWLESKLVSGFKINNGKLFFNLKSLKWSKVKVFKLRMKKQRRINVGDDVMFQRGDTLFIEYSGKNWWSSKDSAVIKLFVL